MHLLKQPEATRSIVFVRKRERVHELRYNRQIILRGFDFDGQEALKDSRVLVVGLGV